LDEEAFAGDGFADLGEDRFERAVTKVKN